jgi:hypothetical protein
MKTLRWEFTTLEVILLCVGAVIGGFGLGLNARHPMANSWL